MARARDYKAEYARRLAKGQASGKTRQQARGHKAHEHIERKEKEREKYGGLTIDQINSVHKWASRRANLQPNISFFMNPDELVVWTQKNGFDEYTRLRTTWEWERRNYRNNPRPKGAMALDEIFDDIDQDGLNIEWLYYH